MIGWAKMSFHNISTLKPLHMTIGSASCRIGVSTAIPPHMRPKIREVSHIYTQPEKRRSGQATKLMNIVCEIADNDQMPLMLFVKPYGQNQSATEHDLVEWYRTKFGFETIQLSPLMMVRTPNSTPTPAEVTETPVGESNE